MRGTRTAELLNSLASLDPPARDALRRVLIRDQADRNEIATEVLRYRLSAGDELAEIIDALTMHPEERRLEGFGQTAPSDGRRPEGPSGLLVGRLESRRLRSGQTGLSNRGGMSEPRNRGRGRATSWRSAVICARGRDENG